jgi:hypothetical protein
MKKILLLIGLLSFTGSTFAQEEERSDILLDGSSISFIYSWKKKPTDSHWTGLSFAFSNLNGLDKENVDLRLNQSYSIDLSLIDYNVPLHHHWLFVTGLGFDWSRYHFKGNIGLQDADGITRFLPDVEGRNYRDSKLLVYYATIPLVLEYQKKIGKGRTFFINGGVEGLINLYAKSQVEVRTQHDGVRKVSYKDLNILPVNFRFVLKTGFSHYFGLFGYYQPYSMFQKGKGPDLTSFGIGICK